MSSLPQSRPPHKRLFTTVESKVSRYFLLMPDGTREPDNELREKVRKACIAFIRFFYENNLLNKPAFDANGDFIDHEYFDCDVIDDGHEMVRRGAESWLDSKSAQKTPPNYSKLNKILSEIRDVSRN